MIDLGGLVARVPPIALAPLTARLDAGIHALLGGKSDGPSIVLGVLAGRLAVRGGSARVLGRTVGDPGVRPSIAYVPLDAVLPEPLRVDEALAAADRIRGGPARDPSAYLEPFGIGALARRAVWSLSREEVRAVALVEALTSAAKVLLVEEPLAGIDPRAAGAIADALRARGCGERVAGVPSGGPMPEAACVVVATGSIRDARVLADDVLTFSRGALVRRASASDPLVIAGPRGARVRVVASDPKRLAAALASDEMVRDVAIDGGVLVAGGADVATIVRAVARGALREGVDLEMLRPDLLREDEMISAISGDAAGAYRAAYERALGPVRAAGREDGAPVRERRHEDDLG
jgi:ABC-type nitrate/sulfonate/bicarbonate transport system ATPase subunit